MRSRPFREIDRFFFAPHSEGILALVRIAVSVVLLLNWLLAFRDVDPFLGPMALFSREAAAIYGPDGWSILHWFPNSLETIYFCVVLGVWSSAACVAGWKTRFHSTLQFVLILSIHHRNPLILNSGDVLIRIFSFFLMICPSPTQYALDATEEHISQGRKQKAEIWPVRLFQFQVCLIYFVTACFKMKGNDWWSGDAAYYATRVEWFWRLRIPSAIDRMWTYRVATWYTIGVEFLFPVLIWFRKTRGAIWIAAILLHLMIEFTMSVQLFQGVMLAGLLAFIEPEFADQMMKDAANKWKKTTGILFGKVQ